MMKKLLLLWCCYCIAPAIHLLACEGNPPTYLSFIENKGQWQAPIQYQVELNNARLYLENNRLTYLLMHTDDINTIHEAHHTGNDLSNFALRCHAYHVNFLNANSVVPTATCQETRYNNYYLGSDPTHWKSHVGIFNQTDYTNIYNGIDMRLYGEDGRIKYDFIVAANANPQQIRLQYEGVDNISIQQKNLHIQTSVNTLIELQPYVYQYINGQLTEVAAEYVLNGNELSFHFPNGYNTNYELIIDPEIVFATYTGSTTDNWGFTATYDNDGHLYAGGSIFTGAGYPTTVGAFQVNFGGGEAASYGAGNDIGITKFTPDGSNLVFSTYLGGSRDEIPESLIVDKDGNLIVLGACGSNNYPTTTGAIDQTFNGGQNITVNSIGFTFGTDLIITKFNPDGTALLASTYLGGIFNDGLNTAAGMRFNYADEGRGEVQVDNQGNIYVVSTTQSPDFPTTDGTFQPEWVNDQDGVLCKLNPQLSQMIWGTYIGGTADDAAYSVKFDTEGYLYACGGTNGTNFPTTTGTLHPNFMGGTADGWVAKISPDGSQLVAATYIGTSNYDQSYFIDLDADNNVYITGQTAGGNYPVSPAGVYSNPNSGNFIHKLNDNLNATLFSTVIGNGSGQPNLSPSAFLVDKCNKIFLSGWGGNVNGGVFGSTTTGIPTSPGAFQTTTDGSDFYFLVLEPNATALHYATFFGANGGTGEHVDGGTSRFDKEGRIYQAVCAGCGSSDLFPTTPGAWSNTNNSSNCNLGAIKFDFEVAPVTADFVPPLPACAPYTVDFENLSVNADDYIWNFGDGSPTTTVVNPSHTFDNPGNYSVQLIAIKPGTCNGQDTISYNVQVASNSTIAITNAQVCAGDSPIQLQAAQSGGTWSGVGVSTNGLFSPEGLSAGEYTVNYSVPTNIPGCVAEGQGTVTIYPTPTISQTTPTAYLYDGTNSFAFDIVVSGYNESFVLSGDFSGTANNNETLTLSHSNNADSYTLVATGIISGCTTQLLILPPPCNADAGTMPPAEQIVCHNGTVSATTIGEFLEPDMVLGYIMHTNDNNQAGTIVGSNSNGTFTFADLNNAQYNQTYYISAVVGYPDTNGLPSINDPCTVVAAGTPVVFLSPIQLVINEDCDWSVGDYTITVFPQGGLPQYDPTANYTLSGTIEETLPFGQSASVVFTSSQTPNNYSFNLNDDLGCNTARAADFPICLKTPIELLNFVGKVQDNGNLLSWTTASETNNHYFSLQRSTDGNSFKDIQQIMAIGNSFTERSYSYLDATPPLATAYYRLLQTDLSGKQTDLGVVVLQRHSATDMALQVAPIPAKDLLFINFVSQSHEAMLQLYNTNGQMVLQQQYQHLVPNNWQSLQLSIEQLPRGIYFLQLQDTHQNSLVKVVKQ